MAPRRADCSRAAFHGNGSNRWFDKSFNYIICRNGRVGINCGEREALCGECVRFVTVRFAEHSPVDAPVFSHMFEALLMGEDQWLPSPETRCVRRCLCCSRLSSQSSFRLTGSAR